MASKLELLCLPEKIEVPVIQVQYHSFMDFYDFGIHYGLASPQHPLKLSQRPSPSPESGGWEYSNPNIPDIQFSLDPHFDRQPAQELPHSLVWGGVGLGHGAYQKARASSHTSSKGTTIILNPYHTAYLTRDIDEVTVQEVVEALAGNRLQPPNWKQKESAFQIDDRDKPLLVSFMLEQLKPYVNRKK